MFIIKRNNSTVAPIKAKGTVVEKLFGEETVTMDFSLPHFVLFRIGDTVEVYGKTYYISQEPVVNKKSSREYVYNLVFNGEKYRLAEVQYFFYDENNELNISEFSITATAQKMVELLVANANRTQTGWSVGNIDSTETKTVDFSEYNCLAALTKISEEFGLEFWIDADKSIHLEERKKVSGYTLEYGKSKGLKGITRNPYTESSLVTRLYARGSSRNIPKNYRNGQKVLRMPVPFLEKNTDKYGIVEHTQPFEDIYPKRVGTVTQVYADNPLKFSDSTLDFDLNEYNEYGNTIIQKGISAKVIFQTGDLAGYTLEVKEYGFDSVSKTFTLLKNQDEKSFDIPSDTFRPQVGDKYIIIDIAMPKSYVENAEQELQAAAQDYLDKNSKQRFIYAVEPDPIYLKKINFNLKLGHTVRFKDTDFNLDDDIRVINITRDINNPYDISFEIAEQATITQIVRNYIEKEKAQTAIKKQQKYNAEMARRSFLFAEEIKNNVFDNEGYFDAQKIKPLSIETGMISVGSRMQQLELPNVYFTITTDNNRLHNTAGQLVHSTIDPNAPRTWNLAENTTLIFSHNFNFIYIKADKIGSNATVIVTEQKIMLDSDPIFYFFLVGSVSSVINGVRRIKTNYGYTQITPSEITTGRITSPNGSNYIDLKQDGIEINAKVTFASNSPAIQQAVDAISVGGRNLVKRSGIKGIVDWFTELEITEPLVIGKEYTLSFTAKKAGVHNGWISVQPPHDWRDEVLNTRIYVSTEEYQEYKTTFIAKATQGQKVWIYSADYYKIDFKGGVKLEKGNKATDHTPAPEDVEQEIIAVKSKVNQIDNLGTMAWENYIEKAMLGDTIVQGGYIKTELLNASAIVSNGGGATSAELNNAINSIIIGGRNLVLDSKKTITNGSHNFNYVFENDFSLIQGKTITVSVDVELNNVSSNGRIGFEPSIVFTDGTAMYLGVWKHSSISENFKGRISATYHIPNKPIQAVFQRGIYIQISGQTTIISNPKFELGNKATDYTPALEDIEAQFTNLQQGISSMQTSLSDVKTKTDNFASIQGGLMMANLMSVGSNQANQNAFISGITDEGAMSVRFGAGSNYANKHNAPFRVLDNGKMIARDADITGKINATGGKIGAFEIIGDRLSASTSMDNNSWEPRSSYALISPEMILFRQNGESSTYVKEAGFGMTQAPSTGDTGAMGFVKNNIKNPYRENTALRLQAKHGHSNIALDILDGDIRVGGVVGYTGSVFLGNRLVYIKNGIIIRV
ncbi:phage tail protein [Riemerella anatipestifer]|uniref:phage tail protein n=1 Tax=Riemerella anatipestifer TaxID=34085 RepID=UPI00236474E1|nr:phage tail protein [Riemerella anatipestifer]